MIHCKIVIYNTIVNLRPYILHAERLPLYLWFGLNYYFIPVWWIKRKISSLKRARYLPRIAQLWKICILVQKCTPPVPLFFECAAHFVESCFATETRGGLQNVLWNPAAMGMLNIAHQIKIRFCAVGALTASQASKCFVSCCNMEGMISQVSNCKLDEFISWHLGR